MMIHHWGWVFMDFYDGVRAMGPTCVMSAPPALLAFLCRERQKAMMQNLEQAVKDKQAQYQRLMHENEQVGMIYAV